MLRSGLKTVKNIGIGILTVKHGASIKSGTFYNGIIRGLPFGDVVN